MKGTPAESRSVIRQRRLSTPRPSGATPRHGAARRGSTAALLLVLACLVLSLKLALLSPALYRSTDFEVHRNWLAITSHNFANASEGNTALANMRFWYRESGHSIWTLDYPPVFGYFEALLSRGVRPGVAAALRFVAARVRSPPTAAAAARAADELDAMAQLAAVGDASPSTVFFQRMSVIVLGDGPLLLAVSAFTVFVLARGVASDVSGSSGTEGADPAAPPSDPQQPRAAWSGVATPAVLVLWIALHPAFLLVDSVHFQYNSLLFALVAVVALLAAKQRPVAAVAAYVLLVAAKHLFLYYVLGVAAWFLALLAARRRSHGVAAALGLLVRAVAAAAVVAAAAFGPLLWSEFQFQERQRATGAAEMEASPAPDAARLARVAADALAPMLRRLFPFGRGLCHSYWAPNAFPLYNALDRALCRRRERQPGGVPCPPTSVNTRGLVGLVDESSPGSEEDVRARALAALPSHAILPSVSPMASNALVVAFFAGALVVAALRRRRASAAVARLLRRQGATAVSPPPSARPLDDVTHLLWLMALSAAAFYLFGYHVHEKAVLAVVFPLLLLVPVAIGEAFASAARPVSREHVDEAAAECLRHADGAKRLLGLAAFLSAVGTASLFPLLLGPRELPLKYAVAAAHFAGGFVVDALLRLRLHGWLEGYAAGDGAAPASSSRRLLAETFRKRLCRPVISRLERWYLVLLAVPAVVYSDGRLSLVPLVTGEPAPFLPLLVLSVVLSLGMIYSLAWRLPWASPWGSVAVMRVPARSTSPGAKA